MRGLHGAGGAAVNGLRRARYPERDRKVCNVNVSEDAYDLIRAEALRSGRTITEVANDIVTRMLDKAAKP